MKVDGSYDDDRRLLLSLYDSYKIDLSGARRQSHFALITEERESIYREGAGREPIRGLSRSEQTQQSIPLAARIRRGEERRNNVVRIQRKGQEERRKE